MDARVVSQFEHTNVLSVCLADNDQRRGCKALESSDAVNRTLIDKSGTQVTNGKGDGVRESQWKYARGVK